MDTVPSNHRCPHCKKPIPVGAPQGLCAPCVLLGAAAPTEAGIAPIQSEDVPSISRIAAAFPQLEIVRCIGQGGMGFVYQARQIKLERAVALKILPDRLAKDPRFAERFHREGQTLARLHHPNIVGVHDFGESGGFCFLMMEYVDGVNLRQAMRAGRFSPGEALSIVPRICDALQYAHDQGIMHRDIKPENILLDSKGTVKIVDFGIAKLLDDSTRPPTLTHTGGTLGTPHYMAPEQLENPREVDHRADIYSLGVVFYEMLTGELPLGRFAPPSEKTPVDRAVDDVVFRSLEKEKDRRFQTAAELGDRVKTLTDTHLQTGPRPNGSGNSGAASPDPKISITAIASAVLVLLSMLTPARWLASQGTARTSLWSEPWMVFVPGLAIGGTICGWLALHRLRDLRGRLRGLPFAAFGAFVWPGSLLVWVSLAPARWASGVSGSHPGSTGSPVMGQILLLTAPAATLTFLLWMIYSTSIWVRGRVKHQSRGLLKWLFLGLIFIGAGAVLRRQSSFPAGVTTGQAPANLLEVVPALTTAGDPAQAMEFMVFEVMNNQLVLTSSQRLPTGESLVTRIQHPDGTTQDVPSSTWSVRSDPNREERFFCTITLDWISTRTQSPNLITLPEERHEVSMEQIFALQRDEFRPVYRMTTPLGKQTRVFVGRRVDHQASDENPARARITLAAVSASEQSVNVHTIWSGLASQQLEAVGLLNELAEVRTETRITQTSGTLPPVTESDLQWTLPPGFGPSDTEGIRKQVTRWIETQPSLLLEPGQKIKLFSTTNTLGSRFSGSLEIPRRFP